MSGKSYIVGILIIFAADYLQYLVHLGTILGFLVVYGIPVAVTSAIFGREIIKRAKNNMGKAFKLGLGLFGAFAVAGIFLSIVALIVISPHHRSNFRCNLHSKEKPATPNSSPASKTNDTPQPTAPTPKGSSRFLNHIWIQIEGPTLFARTQTTD